MYSAKNTQQTATLAYNVWRLAEVGVLVARLSLPTSKVTKWQDYTNRHKRPPFWQALLLHEHPYAHYEILKMNDSRDSGSAAVRFLACILY